MIMHKLTCLYPDDPIQLLLCSTCFLCCQRLRTDWMSILCIWVSGRVSLSRDCCLQCTCDSRSSQCNLPLFWSCWDFVKLHQQKTNQRRSGRTHSNLKTKTKLLLVLVDRTCNYNWQQWNTTIRHVLNIKVCPINSWKSYQKGFEPSKLITLDEFDGVASDT